VIGVNVAADEGFKALAVSKLHIQLATVAFQAEGIELAHRSNDENSRGENKQVSVFAL